MPDAVEHLLKIVSIKQACHTAGVERVEAGPRGATLSFRNQDFANPAGLVAFISQQGGTTKLRPDHKLVYLRSWESIEQRLKGVQHLMDDLAALATAGRIDLQESSDPPTIAANSVA